MLPQLQPRQEQPPGASRLHGRLQHGQRPGTHNGMDAAPPRGPHQQATNQADANGAVPMRVRTAGAEGCDGCAVPKAFAAASRVGWSFELLVQVTAPGL